MCRRGVGAQAAPELLLCGKEKGLTRSYVGGKYGTRRDVRADGGALDGGVLAVFADAAGMCVGGGG